MCRETQPSGTSPPMSNILTAASQVDASVWRAMAGGAVKIPPVDSCVYYFPQGHLEHSSPSPSSSSSDSDDADNYNFALQCPLIPCLVLSAHCLASSTSDQAFARILLQPLQLQGLQLGDDGREDGDDSNDVVSFAKVLTRSDANNGGGFSVPRYCADMILPHLDYAADPPVQNLIMKDAHNVAWEFRHIYRGTPRRHLLTTGWSKFVNAKSLVAGDSVVFIRKTSTDELFIGIRRAQIFGGGDEGRGRAEALATIENSVRGMPFEVLCYPKIGEPDFVVRVEKVNKALGMNWCAGMKVRMAVETDDSSRMSWIQGVIAAVTRPNSGMWCGSPWRMLQITWDDAASLQGVNRVSPWEIEYFPLTPMETDFHHSSKKFKSLQDSGILPPRVEKSYTTPPTTDLIPAARSIALHSNNYPPPLPASIQGARLDHFSTTSLSLANGMAEELQDPGSVSTALSIGFSYPNTPSAASHSSDQLSCASSFQLFGKTIKISGHGDGGTSNGVEKCTPA